MADKALCVGNILILRREHFEASSKNITDDLGFNLAPSKTENCGHVTWYHMCDQNSSFGALWCFFRAWRRCSWKTIMPLLLPLDNDKVMLRTFVFLIILGLYTQNLVSSLLFKSIVSQCHGVFSRLFLSVLSFLTCRHTFCVHALFSF